MPAGLPYTDSIASLIMSFQLYLSFLLASLALIVSPGPVNVLVMSQALRAGWRSALPSMWGATAAMLLQLLLTALCLTSLMHLNSALFDALRWIGAAFLIFLGCKQWRADGALASTQAGGSRMGQFWRGFATSGVNPKTLLFFPSFFPQFMRADAPWSPLTQFAVLAASFALLFVGGIITNALCSHPLRGWLHHPPRVRGMNRVLGSLLIVMGALMAAAR
jgi:threonine/homoserine/homoserine lactone efflux protein